MSYGLIRVNVQESFVAPKGNLYSLYVVIFPCDNRPADRWVFYSFFNVLSESSTERHPLSWHHFTFLFFSFFKFTQAFRSLTSSSEYLNHLFQVGRVKITAIQSLIFSI